ncbi:MAG: PLP-dependent aminotransferase family protein [Alphaproteobacteria bacterium]|nr:PLP-dependent aminotransferase family protein [Alphaproteobacteria bacterium]
MKSTIQSFDFSENYPAQLSGVDSLVQKEFQVISNKRNFVDFLEYPQNKDNFLGIETNSHKKHLLSVYKWLNFLGATWCQGTTIVSAGALHAQYISLAYLTKPGDVVLTASLASSAVKSLGNALGIVLKGIDSDEEGPLVEDLEDLINSFSPKAVILMSNVSVPTGSSISLARRKQIAELLISKKVPLVENDVFGAFPENKIPPISSFMPELSFYLTSLSKVVSPALRVGFLVVPPSLYAKVLNFSRLTIWTASPILMEVISELIENKNIFKIIEMRRKDLLQRKRLFESLFKKETSLYSAVLEENSSTVWVKFKTLKGGETSGYLQRNGILVNQGGDFSISKQSTGAIRLCLTSFSDFEALEEGLLKLMYYLQNKQDLEMKF